MTKDIRAELARRFGAERTRLRMMARRLLGSNVEAEDAVQQSWLRLDAANAEEIRDLPSWLTTTVSRICLDLLRKRRSRREDHEDESSMARRASVAPNAEDNLVLAGELSEALGILMHRLAPAERVAFVLHEMFDLPFADIAEILGRNNASARQLASRARKRIQGRPAIPPARLAADRSLVAAYLEATRTNDLPGLLAILDPEVVLKLDARTAQMDRPTQVTGADIVARRALGYGARVHGAFVLLIDGHTGIAIPSAEGRLAGVLKLTTRNGRIAIIDIVAEPRQLSRLALGLAPSEMEAAFELASRR